MKSWSIHHLLSMQYGLGPEYSVIANREATQKRLLVESVLEQRRASLCPRLRHSHHWTVSLFTVVSKNPHKFFDGAPHVSLEACVCSLCRLLFDFS